MRIKGVGFPWRVALVIVGVLVLATVGAVGWLYSNANQVAPRAMAVEFLQHLHAGRLEEARRLTAESPFFGSSDGDLAQVASQQLCGSAGQPVSTHPPQTNGNRLRRWLSQSEVEMPEVSVEFAGKCLIRVMLRHQPSGDWRVYRLVRHAG